MQIFNDLHVVAWNNNAGIAKSPHLSARKASKANGGQSKLLGERLCLEYIRRIATPADCECHIIALREIEQLLRKNIFVIRVVCPSSHQGNIVGQSHHT